MRPFWTSAYRNNIGKMIGVCYRYTMDRQTAEDLAHDAFLAAIEKADTFRGVGSFEGWLMRIAMNKALHYLRDQERIRPLNDDTAVEDSGVSEEEETFSDNMMAAIRKADFSHDEILDAIAQLPDHHRTVLNLYVFERLTHPQIAELLGISQNTSKSHLMRARKELQQILFNKSKEKKRLFMILFPLFIHPDTAIDAYCRQQLNGFAMPPLQPLPDEAFPNSCKVSPRMWMHVHRVPLTAGLAATGAAIATAGILLTSAPKTNQVQQPKRPEQQSVTVVSDSLAESPSEETSPYELEQRDSIAKRRTQTTHKSKTPQNTTPSITAPVDTTTAAPEAPKPVVVKKVKRTNRTIVIKDSAK
jgi:RNA polymerase sigma factor (sigma-70 family)